MAELAFLALVLLVYAGICHAVGRIALDLCRLESGFVLPGAGLLLGAAFLAIQLWIYGVLHIPWTALTLLLPWALLAVLRRGPTMAWFEADLNALRALPRSVASLGPLSVLLLAVALALGIAYGILVLEQPLGSWDGIAVWLYKAKVFYVGQALDLGNPALQPVGAPLVDRNLNYPPLFSLMAATLYTLAGHVQDSLGKALNLIFLGAASGACFSFFQVRLGAIRASVLCLLLIAVPAFQPFLISGVYFGYADIALGIWMMLTLAHLLLVREGLTRAGLVAVALAAGAALTKAEGVSLLVLVLLTTGLPLILRWRKTLRWREPLRWDRSLVLPGVMLGAIVAWQITLQLDGIQSQQLARPEQLGGILGELSTRATKIASFFSGLGHRQALYPWIAPEFPWLVAALAITTILLAADRFRQAGVAYIVIVGQAAAYTAVYLLTPYDLDWLLATSGDRLLIQLVPGLILLLGAGLVGSRDLTQPVSGLS